jgi:XTP/dITP diphosphohydrolase
MIKIVLATNNKHKISEFRSCFSQMGIEAEIITVKEAGFNGEIVEDADTFEGNSYIKAKALCDFSGCITIADDSGLEVDALNGAPGVYSARYSGEHATDMENIEKLWAELKKVPEKPRNAKFVSAVCVCRPDGRVLTLRGECEGVIIDELQGEGRFGYDPVFLYEPMNKTFAEMTSEEKNSVSHRGRAIKKLLDHKEFFSE